MELFIPDVGLAFWMLVSFGLVVFILRKFAWTSIMGALNARQQHISDSLKAAEEAQERLKNIQQEGAALMAKAQEEQVQILLEAKKIKDKTINEAKDIAKQEAQKMVEQARVSIQREKEEALLEIRKQVVLLSVDIAEKVLRKDLDDKDAQMSMVNRLLDEINTTKQ